MLVSSGLFELRFITTHNGGITIVNSKHYILAALAILIVLTVSLFAGCTSSSGTTTNTTGTTTASPAVTPTPWAVTTTIKAGYLPTTGHALLFVAKEEGYFAKQGLNVELSQFPNSADGYNALTAGKLDVIAMGSTAPSVYIAKGTDLRLIGGLMGEGAAAITLPQNAEKYKNISSWKGKTIATVRMSTGDVVYRSAMQDAGLNWSTDVTIQELKSPSAVLDAVKSGKVDVGIVWLPYQQVAEAQGLTIISYGDEFRPGHPCCRLAVTNTTLTGDRDTYVRFEKALIEAYLFAKTNETGTVNDVAKFADFNKSIIRDSIYSEHFTFSPDPNKKAIKGYWNMMLSEGYINSTANIDNYVDTTVYKQALDEVIKENPKDPLLDQLLDEYTRNNL